MKKIGGIKGRNSETCLQCLEKKISWLGEDMNTTARTRYIYNCRTDEKIVKMMYKNKVY